MILSNGQKVKSSEGAQQGGGFAGLLFDSVIQFIFLKLKKSIPNHKQRLRLKIWFHDDTQLGGYPEEVALAIKLIHEWRKITGLRMKLGPRGKCVVYCATPEQAEKIAPLFKDIKDENGGFKIIPHFNIETLNTPIGSNEHVSKFLHGKLEELKMKVDAVVEFGDPEKGGGFKHEAFRLFQKCATACRVTHLMRTLPPHQSEPFIKKFDELVREGFEKLIGRKLRDPDDVGDDRDWRWRLAKLQSKVGCCLCTGTSTWCSIRYLFN